MSEVSTPVSGSRVLRRRGGRKRRACDSCSQKKIQCDAGFPQCNWCTHRRLACTYNGMKRRMQAISQTSLPFLDKVSSADIVSNSAPVLHLGSLRCSAFHGGRVAYFNSIHLLSDEGRQWIERQVGEKVSHEKLYALELPWMNPSRLNEDTTMSSFDYAPDLPSRKIVHMHVVRYTSSFQSLVFPVIGRSLFSKTLDLAYGPRHAFGHASAKACVYSFLSFVTLFGFDDDVHGAAGWSSYASASQILIPHIIQETTVDGVQSLLMLAQFQYFLGHLQQAAASISIVTRLIYMLGAHRLPTDENPAVYMPSYNKSTLECHLRDLFWLCYSLDKDICLRTGQPPCIDDSECNLSLPVDYVQLQNSNIQQENIIPDDYTQPLFPWDLRLSIIKSEAYRTLYSASARLKTNSEIISRILHLDAALEQWRLSLQPDIRPILCVSGEMALRTSPNTQEVILRLAYYHCVIIIHQASGRCKLSRAEPGNVFEGIGSSICLSIAASRSSLSLIQSALPMLKGECFWVVLFYALTAILTIFCDIVKDPLQISSDTNVKLLYDVPTLMCKIPIRYLTPVEIMHLKFLDGFTTELARLGRCAISKAQEELHVPREAPIAG